MKRQRWWMGLVVVAVLVIGGRWLGPELWARSWESRWEEFRSEWEAKGEDFSVESHMPSPLPDEENMASHPFMLELAADGEAGSEGRWQAREPENVDGFSEVRGEQATGAMAEALAGHPDVLRRLDAHFAAFADDFDRFAEAMARPGCRVRINLNDGLEGAKAPWSTWARFAQLVQVRAAMRMALGDEGGFVSDAETLIRMGNHLRYESYLVGAVVGVGADVVGYRLIRDGLDRELVGEDSRRRLAVLLAAPRPGPGDVLATVMRGERGFMLRELARIEASAAGAGPDGPAVGAMAWLPQKAVRRVFFARNRLALCEEMQRCLLAPEGVPRNDIRISDIPVYSAALDERFADERPMDAFALIALPTIEAAAAKLERAEVRRQELITRLRK